MKIALLHLDLAGGPVETNEKILLAAVRQAAEAGADWVVTPETAREGYFFYKKDPKALRAMALHRNDDFQPFLDIAREKGITLFLSAAEKVAEGKAYNSCFILSPEGKAIGCHRKMYSHQCGAEGWISLDDKAEVYELSGVRTGLFVCADAYYERPCELVKQVGADLVVVSAAWPPGECCREPKKVWQRTSLWTGSPVCVCNQTGRYDSMDMTVGESAVLDGGECLFAYHGAPAILLWDFDEKEKRVASKEFSVVPFSEG